MNETILRGVVFGAVFLILLAVEFFIPWRRGGRFRPRWWTNLGLIGVSSVLLALSPLVPVGAAFWADAAGVGLFNVITVHPVAAGVMGFVLLDLAVWGQHIALHLVHPFWRLHAVHHADPALDATTGLRFHPGEMVVSLAYKLGVVIALGVSPVTVIVFEVVLNAASMFTHANMKLPDRLDMALRRIMVTPGMHRVHHSVIVREHCSNYGFFLSVWDRLFRTYRVRSVMGDDGIRIGLAAMHGAGGSFVKMLGYPGWKKDRFPDPKLRHNME